MKETMKIYGPYTRKDKRQVIVIVHDSGKKQTKSYPRHLMEIHLGRELLPKEHIDHINNDPSDNRIENLQILSQKENNKKQSLLKPRQTYKFICPCCGKESEKNLNYVLGNKKKNRTGPFCSRQCAGKFTYTSPSMPD